MTDEISSFEEALERCCSTETSDTEKNAFLKAVQELKSTTGWMVDLNDSLFNKERGPQVLRDLLIQFNVWKSNNLSEYASLQRPVLYRVAKICFFYAIKDSALVSDVLKLVYKCDGHFSMMLLSIVYHHNEEITAEEKLQKEYLSNLYFLTHAHRAKLEFSGVRYVDCKDAGRSLIVFAAYYGTSNLLLLLLRHGADVQEYFSLAHTWNLKNILQYLIATLSLFIKSDTKNAWEVEDTCVDKLSRCLRYLTRVIRQIPISEMQFRIRNFSNLPEGVISDSRIFIRSISDRGFVPKLFSRYVEPPELRHLCRFTIRDALNKNWNLPYGISSLPLPKVLQRYVNLSGD